MIKKIIVLLCIFLASSAMLHAQEDGSQQFQGFDVAGYDGEGNKTWDIKGDTADILGEIIALTNIVANAYGEENMHLTADDGTLNKDSGNIHLENNVVITTETGTQMLTDSLDWDRKGDLVKTKDEVTITKEEMVATGTGMEARPNLKTAQMNEDVDVKIDMASQGEPGRVITITCDGTLEIEYEKQQAVFNENVVAIDGDRKLTADRVELYFDQESNKIKELICIGNVVITQGENASYSDRAIYKAQEQRVILSGRPKIIFYTPEDEEGAF